MSTIKRFEEIISWKEARELNRVLRKLIKEKRFERNFGLISQIERSAGSIMDNIAEGFERGGNKEFIQFLYIAKGSCGELRSQMYRAIEDGYINEEEFNLISNYCNKISNLIFKLIEYLKASDLKGQKFNKAYRANKLFEPLEHFEPFKQLNNNNKTNGCYKKKHFKTQFRQLPKSRACA